MKRPAYTVLLITLMAMLSFSLSACSGLPPLAGLTQLANQSQATPETTLFIAKQAPLVASALVSPQQQAQVLFAGESAGQAGFLGTSGLSYAKDIQPWVGDEVTFAVTTTDLDRDPSNGTQPGYLLAMTIAKPQRSQAFIPLLWQKRAVPSEALQVETYQGVKLTYQDDAFSTNPPKSRSMFRSLATAQIGDRYLLIANHPKVLRDAINNAQAPDLSLSSTSVYQTAIKTLSDKQWGWIFVNLPGLGSWSQLEHKPLTTTSDLPTYRFDKLAIALRSQRNGLAVDTLFSAAPEQTVEAFSPSLGRTLPVLNYLPSKSGLGITGQALSTLWPTLKTSFQGYPTLLNLLEQPQLAFAQHAKISLFDQVINWVHGQYGLAMLPTASSTQPDWLFIAERSPDLEAALANLNALAQKAGYTTVEVTVAGQPVSTWTQLPTETAVPKEGQPMQPQIGAAHTTIGEYELFATSVEAIKAALSANSGQSLADSPTYQQAIAPLTSPNAGTLYMEWAAMRPLLEKAIPPLKWLTLGMPNLFKDLKTLTMSSLPSEAGTRHNLISVQVN